MESQYLHQLQLYRGEIHMNQRINGSLNVKADDKHIFRLEVNEKHECIEIDTSDITISARIMKLFDGFETFKNEFKRREIGRAHV